ncbi:flavin reductase [Specibacter sp. RAF43]|uniref:flavin reductase n=1 Tax=Specibacter sp. RAF43 TaxID=3233057 RepID=UPI003F952569
MTFIDSARFREVLGQYPTGVVVITATDSGVPIGMTVGSFVSVSLDPPYVAFLPDRNSSSWAALKASGTQFCVNVLAAEQEEASRLIATRKTDKFVGIDWTASRSGNPVIHGSIASIDCEIVSIAGAGDHEIVVARVVDLDVLSAAYPLLFFRGGYGSFSPRSMAARDVDIIDQLGQADRFRPQMESLAARFGSEVTAVLLKGDDLVLAVSAGRVPRTSIPSRVGRRIPFAPPIGSVFAAFGGSQVREPWLSKAAALSSMDREDAETILRTVRDRGYSVTFGHAQSNELEKVVAGAQVGMSASVLEDAARLYNPASFDSIDPRDLRSISAPVFGPEGDVAFNLTLWNEPAAINDTDALHRRADAVLTTVQDATRAVRGD